MPLLAESGVAAPAPRPYPLPGFHEPFSAFSHLLGALAFLALGALLLRRGRGDRPRLIYLGVYAASCVLLLSLSGVYIVQPASAAPPGVMKPAIAMSAPKR